MAADGQAGIEQARAFHPEVILCDLGLPVINGYEVARAVRDDDALQGAYLVALTGYAQPEDVRRSAAAGFDRHVAKPVGLAKLRQVLAEFPGAQEAAPGPTTPRPFLH